jgi:hypothetical protein
MEMKRTESVVDECYAACAARYEEARQTKLGGAVVLRSDDRVRLPVKAPQATVRCGPRPCAKVVRTRRAAVQETREMARFLIPSSFECNCGHQSHFFESTIREMEAASRRRRKRLRLLDSEREGHGIEFENGVFLVRAWHEYFGN